jgi:DNA-binding transcriptional MerR regulator
MRQLLSILMGVEPEGRYGIEELADLGGVTRRTVRYYLQEGLLPPPLGLGRGRHYGEEHLKRLLEVKALQEEGLPLVAIRAGVGGAGRHARALEARAAAETTLPRSAWSRLEILPGVELNVSSAYRLPSPGRIRELAEWCRLHFRPEEESDDA